MERNKEKLWHNSRNCQNLIKIKNIHGEINRDLTGKKKVPLIRNVNFLNI